MHASLLYANKWTKHLTSTMLYHHNSTCLDITKCHIYSVNLHWPDLHHKCQQALSLSSALSIITVSLSIQLANKWLQNTALLYEQNVPFAWIHCANLVTFKCPQPCQYHLFHFPYNHPTQNGNRTLLPLIWAKCTLCMDTLCHSDNH